MFKCGLAGCLAPAFDLGQVVCVHVCVWVHTFDKATTHEDCMKEIEDICTDRFNLHHVWMAMCDIHKSDKSGQSREDVGLQTSSCTSPSLCIWISMCAHACLCNVCKCMCCTIAII